MSLQDMRNFSKVKQFGQEQKVGALFVKAKSTANISLFLSHKGFQPRNSILRSTYENFQGITLNIVMPNGNLIFSKLYRYPNKSQVRTGGDYLAALYLGEALSFKPKYDERLE